jgi:AraC-like DNA-binding protein
MTAGKRRVSESRLMEDTGAVVLAYQSEDEPVQSRLERLRHITESALAPLEIRTAQPDFGGQIVAAGIGAVQVFELTIDTPAEVVRTPKLIRRSDPEMFKIDVMTDGAMMVRQSGREALLGPGDLALVDMSRPGYWLNQACRFVALSFPRALLPFRPDEVGELTAVRIGGDCGAGALISALARQVPRHLDEYRVGDSVRVGSALLDLITAALAARLDRESQVVLETRQGALLLRIHAFIEQRLSDPELSPSTVAAAHHISVRYLHRLFQSQQTTVADWIRQRRLDRCRHDLLDPALRRWPVGRVGVRWGFLTPGQFSRAFRTEYGLPPGEYRLRAIQAQGCRS